MAGYAYNWNDSDISDAMTQVKCSGMISAAGGDGYGGTNWCFGLEGGGGGQWHVHFNGGADGRKVNVVRWKTSSTDAGGSNVVKFLTNGAGWPTQTSNLKNLAVACADYPQHKKLLEALHVALGAWTTANTKK